MITNIFKRVSIKSVIVSFFLTYLAFIFNLYVSDDQTSYKVLLEKSLLLTIVIMIFNLIIAYNEQRKLNIRFGSQYLISLPVCIFLFYYDAENDFQDFLMTTLILFSLNIFSRDFNKSSILKSIFGLGIVFTTMSFVNINLSIFFFSIIFLFRGLINKEKAYISLVCSVAVTLQFLFISTYLITGKFFYRKLEYISATNFFPENEFIWITIIVIAFVIGVFHKRKNKINFSPQNKILNAFMLFWLITSVFFRYLNIYPGEGRWILSLMPTAYFLGIAIKEIKKDFWKDFAVISLIFVAIISKLYL